jgi:hypothetical protein
LYRQKIKRKLAGRFRFKPKEIDLRYSLDMESDAKAYGDIEEVKRITVLKICL